MMMDNDACGAVSGLLHRGNRSTWRKPASVLLCPPQIPHDLSWAQTQPVTNHLSTSMAITFVTNVLVRMMVFYSGKYVRRLKHTVSGGAATHIEVTFSSLLDGQILYSFLPRLLVN
jgi:hypothetical protein